MGSVVELAAAEGGTQGGAFRHSIRASGIRADFSCAQP